MKRILFILLFALTWPMAAGATDCPPLGYSREQLLELRRGGFVMESAAERDALAASLLACLSDPDPAIRDGVVFEGLSAWLRAGQLSPDALKNLYAGLLSQLGVTDDANGFQQPFAALVLSELARTDRIDPWMTPAMRDDLVRVAATYLAAVRDYRGFSETGRLAARCGPRFRPGAATGAQPQYRRRADRHADGCGVGPGVSARRSFLHLR